MKIYNLYVDGKGVFHYIKELLDPESLLTLVEPSTTDLLFVGLHGGRDVSPLVNRVIKGETITESDLQLLASLLYGMFGQRWENLAKVYAETLPLETYRLITTENIDDLGESTQSTTNTQTDSKKESVSGFNSIDFVDSNQDTSESSDSGLNEGKNKNNRTRTTEVKGNMSNILDDRTKTLDLVRNNIFIEDIFKDVSVTLGSLMY